MPWSYSLALLGFAAVLPGCATSSSPAPTPQPELAERAVAAPAPRLAAITPERVSVKFEGTPLSTVLARLGDKVGWNLVLEPGVVARVDLVLHDVPWRIALGQVLKQTKCEAQQRGEQLLYVHQPPRITIQ